MFGAIYTQKCESCANNKQLCCLVCGIGQNGEREYYKPKTKTNGDRLRAMNNEELCNEYFRILNHVLGRYTDSRAGLLEWLKQPVE